MIRERPAATKTVWLCYVAATAHAFSNIRPHVKIRTSTLSTRMYSTVNPPPPPHNKQSRNDNNNNSSEKEEEILNGLWADHQSVDPSTEDNAAASFLNVLATDDQNQHQQHSSFVHEIVNGHHHSHEVQLDEILPTVDTAVPATDLTESQPEEELSIVPPIATASKTDDDGNSIGQGQILKFAIPAIGVWLCGPLLSCIDTASVGLLSGTAQQAALSPAVAVTDYSALLLAFIYTATTNLMATNNVEENQDARNTLVQSLRTSFYSGLVLAVGLLWQSSRMVRALMGNGVEASGIFGPALRYVRIRALGMPAAAIIGCAQAACLGLKDIRAPFYTLGAAAVVNFFGDVLLVGRSGKWVGGTAGAAWATVASQYVAMGCFLRWLIHKKQDNMSLMNEPKQGTEHKMNLTAKILDITGSNTGNFNSSVTSSVSTMRHKILQTPSPIRTATSRIKRRAEKQLLSFNSNKNNKKQSSFSTKGYLSDSGFSPSQVVRFPSKSILNQFRPYVLPVTSSSIGRVSMYIAMNYVVSSTLGASTMAAQQIILSIFYCLCPIADSLNLTAQSFIPGVTSPGRRKKLVRELVKTGILFGLAMMGLVSCIPLISHWFTSDPSVISSVNNVVPMLLGIFSLHGLAMAGEGILLGLKDLGFLGKAFSAFFLVVPYAMLSMKKVLGSALTLNSLWGVFAAYQVVRTGMWLSRISSLNRRHGDDRSVVSSFAETVPPPIVVLDDVGIPLNDLISSSETAATALMNTIKEDALPSDDVMISEGDFQ